MKTIIKKGKISTSIQCSNGFFSNNLYCENISLTTDDLNQSVAISLDFSKEFNNKSYNIDDCRQLIDYLNEITTITFYDSYSVKRIVEYFRLHPFKEYIRKIELIFDKVHLLNANFVVKNGDSLVLMISK